MDLEIRVFLQVLMVSIKYIVSFLGVPCFFVAQCVSLQKDYYFNTTSIVGINSPDFLTGWHVVI